VFHQTTEVSKEEVEWSHAAQQGDVEAFTNLIQRYERAVYNLCYRMLGNANDAEDAAQETFLRAYKAIGRYDPSRRFSTWVLSIGTNYCIDQLRKRRLFTLSLDDMPFLDVSEDAPGPEGTMALREKQAEINVLLAQLNGKDKAAVIMRYWYDLSYDEIAETLSLTNSAVKSRLHRARHALALAMEPQGGQPQPIKDQSMPYEAQIV